MMLWGAVTIGMAFSPNYRALVGFRFVMGLLESGFAPGVLVLLSSWYRKEEQGKRFAIYISAAIISGAFGGILAGVITDKLDQFRGIRGWRWLFIIEGAITIVVAMVSAFVLPDFPENTSRKKFDDQERQLAIERLRSASEPDAREARVTHLTALRLGLTNFSTWLFVLGYMVCLRARSR